MTSLKELLQLFLSYSLERQFYTEIDGWAISWRGDQPYSWVITRTDSEEHTCSDDASILVALQFRDIDMYQFEAEVRAKLNTEIALANKLLTEAEEVLGEPYVDDMIERYAGFLTGLHVEVRDPAKPEPKKPTLTVVK